MKSSTSNLKIVPKKPKCPPCYKPVRCTELCEEIEVELAKLEKPLRETLFSYRNLEALEVRNAAQQYFVEEQSNDLIEANDDEDVAAFVSYQSLYTAMESLSDRQRECLYFSYWKGLSLRQIADKLGLTHSTIKHHLQTAIKALKKSHTDSVPVMSGIFHSAYILEGLDSAAQTAEEEMRRSNVA